MLRTSVLTLRKSLLAVRTSPLTVRSSPRSEMFSPSEVMDRRDRKCLRQGRRWIDGDSRVRKSVKDNVSSGIYVAT